MSKQKAEETKKEKTRIFDAIGPFTTIPNSVVKMGKQIGVDALALFVYLRYRTNSESGVAFPSYTTISKDTGLSRARISKALDSLEKHALLSREKRFGNSTIYVLMMPPVVRQVDYCKPPVVQHPNYSSPDVELSVVHTPNTNKTDLINTDIIEEEKKELTPAIAGDPKELSSPKNDEKKSSSKAPSAQAFALVTAFAELFPTRGLNKDLERLKFARVCERLVRLEKVGPRHIPKYYALMRDQWNESKKMKDKPITPWDLADYIEARYQNANGVSEEAKVIKQKASPLLREIEQAEELAEKRAEQERAREQARRSAMTPQQRAEEDRAIEHAAALASAWERVAQEMQSQLAGHARTAEPRDLCDGVLTVAVHDPSWLNTRAQRITQGIAQRAGLAAIQWVERQGASA